MFKHIKFLQGGSGRYHGILVSIEGLWPNLVSVQQSVRLAALCLTMSSEHSCPSGTGPDSHRIFRHLRYPNVDFLDE